MILGYVQYQYLYILIVSYSAHSINVDLNWPQLLIFSEVSGSWWRNSLCHGCQTLYWHQLARPCGAGNSLRYWESLRYWQDPAVLAAACSTGNSLWYWRQPVVLVTACGTGDSLQYWWQSAVLVTAWEATACGTGNNLRKLAVWW